MGNFSFRFRDTIFTQRILQEMTSEHRDLVPSLFNKN